MSSGWAEQLRPSVAAPRRFKGAIHATIERTSGSAQVTQVLKMYLLPKWLSLILALGAVFVPLVPAAATSLKVEGSGSVPGFNSSELRRYLTLHMAEAQPANWRFEPAAAGYPPAPGRVKWRFKLDPYAGGEVRTFVPPQMVDKDFAVHRPITIEARLYLNGRYQTLAKEKAIIQGGPDDPDLAAAVVNLTQNLLSPSGAYRPSIAVSTSGQHQWRPVR